MGHIHRHHLDEPGPVPQLEEVGLLSLLMSRLWDRVLAVETESPRLAASRDELLPLMMSGKLVVKDAEQVVSDVAALREPDLHLVMVEPTITPVVSFSTRAEVSREEREP